MAGREPSDSGKDELLEILTELHGLLEGRRADAATSSATAASKLELAFKRQINAPQSRVSPHPQLLAAIVEASPDAITSRTLDGILLTWNRGAERMYGYAAHEVIGRPHDRLLPEGGSRELEAINARLARGESIQDLEAIRIRKDGTPIHVSINLAPILEQGHVVRVCTISRDIGARKATEAALQEALAQARAGAAELAAVLDAVPAAVFIAHDRDCQRVTGNRAACELFDLPAGSNMSAVAAPDGTPPPFRVYRDGEELGTRERPVEMAARRGIEVRGFEQDLVFADGTVRHLIGNAKPLHDGAGNITGAVAAFVDISERKQAEERVRRMAHLDPLTHLPNRILLMDRLQQALTVSQRNRTRTAVLFLDLDRFKEINDSRGHHVGDQLLQEVAARLRATIREADTVSRLGGDEFIVVLPELHGADDATNVAQKLLDALSQDYVVTGHSVRITPSIGIALFPDHGSEPGHLLRLADKAMYRAKQAGGGTACVHPLET